MAGILYGVGVGPGDPELITIKAVNIINKADIIIAPKTEKKNESIALGIASKYINNNTKIVFQVFPMTKDETEINKTVNNNAEEIKEFLKNDKVVVFLTLGDPMLYSTYIYIYKLLKDEYNIVTIPGITSFSDIAARTGFPLAEKDEILKIIPATTDINVIESNLEDYPCNLVLMKVYKNAKELINKLELKGCINKFVMATNSGLKDEKIVYSPDEIKNTPKKYLSTILAKKDNKI